MLQKIGTLEQFKLSLIILKSYSVIHMIVILMSCTTMVVQSVHNKEANQISRTKAAGSSEG